MGMLERFRLLLSLWCVLGAVAARAAEPLQRFDGCTLVDAAWADGDSFQARFPDGTLKTLRLYGADCIEMHVDGNDSVARRLRDQRRYFGIQDIRLAKSLGEAAKVETVRVLARPFTVHTAFADGRGDARFGRVYAFVTTADGRDLSAHLVSTGLARAFGVTRERADGVAGDEWREQLQDLELTAARAGVGAWKHTDWDKLAVLRKEARDEQAELADAQGGGNKAPVVGQWIDPNRASKEELMRLPGVGAKLAGEIIAARPFRSIDDLDRVAGIGPKMLAKIRPMLRIGAFE